MLVFVVLFWRLGAPTFWDPDEAHYAETSREMIVAGDYWAPHYNGQPFFDKPALFHQMQAAAMRVVGADELGARLVPALAALALVAVTYWFASAVASPHVALVAALLLTVSPGLFALARYAILDTVFTLFTFGGAAALSVAALRDRPRLQWIGYVGIALGVAVKGPLAIVLCGLAFVSLIVVSPALRRPLVALRWKTGLALVVGVASPWFVYMYLRYGQQFVDGYVLDENVRLFASSRFGNQPGPWFYFQILATGLLPWTGLVVGRLIDDVRAALRGERLDALEILLWTWTAVVVGFFTLSTFKLDHYVFPAAPALCVLAARAWVDMGRDEYSARHAATRAGGYLVGPLLVALGVGAGYFLVLRLDLPREAIAVPIVITACGVALTTYANVRGRMRLAPPVVPWFGLVALGVTYGGIVLFVMPALEQRKVVPDVARFVASHADGGVRVASFRLNRWTPALRFYVDRPMEFLEGAREAEAFLRAPQPFYCVMRRAAFDEFVAHGVPLRIVYQRQGMWATSGRALWRRRESPAQFVVVTRP
ncbi:MAG TPA: glycosyltransferase family 39 protein [Vicinamibacterales bacterium]|nr:glycosyltransferase family 39 protein [Vicinamibacterales bacterium]